MLNCVHFKLVNGESVREFDGLVIGRRDRLD